MINDVTHVLKKLEIEDRGKYTDGFYVIQLDDSNEYAKMFTLLNKNATNTEYPNFGKNSNNTTVNVQNYFEIEDDETKYNIFLLADFINDDYKLKIGEATA